MFYLIIVVLFVILMVMWVITVIASAIAADDKVENGDGICLLISFIVTLLMLIIAFLTGQNWHYISTLG